MKLQINLLRPKCVQRWAFVKAALFGFRYRMPKKMNLLRRTKDEMSKLQQELEETLKTPYED